MDVAKRDKLSQVCGNIQGLVWTVRNKIRGDGDGYGSAYPESDCWRQIADSIADLLGSSEEEKQEIKSIVLGHDR